MLGWWRPELQIRGPPRATGQSLAMRSEPHSLAPSHGCPHDCQRPCRCPLCLRPGEPAAGAWLASAAPSRPPTGSGSPNSAGENWGGTPARRRRGPGPGHLPRCVGLLLLLRADLCSPSWPGSGELVRGRPCTETRTSSPKAVSLTNRPCPASPGLREEEGES